MYMYNDSTLTCEQRMNGMVLSFHIFEVPAHQHHLGLKKCVTFDDPPPSGYESIGYESILQCEKLQTESKISKLIEA